MKVKKNVGKCVSIISCVVLFALIISLVFMIFSIKLMDWRYDIVKSPSMGKALPMKSLAITIPDKRIIPGDVVVYEKENKFIAHRVVSMGIGNKEVYFQTKGDANDDPDSEPVTKNMIKGKVIYHIPYVGIIFEPLGRFINIVRNVVKF